MWSQYLNGGVEQVITDLTHDGLKAVNTDGSVSVWRTIHREPNKIDGVFEKEDGNQSTHQTFCWDDNKFRVAYYAPGEDSPYLTYVGVRKDTDTISVTRKWSDKEVSYEVVVKERQPDGKIAAYQCLTPEGTWNITLTYSDGGLLIQEDMVTPEGSGTMKYEYDENNILLIWHLNLG